MLDDYVEIEESALGVIYYSKVNSNFAVVPYGEIIADEEEFLYGNGLLTEVESVNEWDVDTVYICLHISSQCNLCCSYCFKNERVARNLNEREIRRFIEYVHAIYPDTNRYIIDMSGSGEPLLNKDMIKTVCAICHEYSDKYFCEFQPRLATNGTLLTEDNVKFLQNEGVLFGISIDGTKKCHDKNRRDKLGNGTYSKILNNIKHIDYRAHIGAAVTVTNDNCNVLKNFKTLIKFFPTISMKPVRYKNGTVLNSGLINYNYDKLYSFLLRKTLQGNLDYLRALLNGDDYFGKFIRRVYSGVKAQTRCDAGVSRMALASNGKIYACPSAEGLDEFYIGDIDDGININKMNSYKRHHLSTSECEGCVARYVCGGKCLVENKYLQNDYSETCKINTHLYKLAVKFYIATSNSYVYDDIIDILEVIDGYSKNDEQLRDLAKRLVGKYTYTQLKRMKDADSMEYQNLINMV